MKNAINPALAQIGDQFLPQVQGRQEHVEHVIGLFTMTRGHVAIGRHAPAPNP